MNDNNKYTDSEKSPLGGIRGIIFDLDGTLLDSAVDIAEANNSVLEKMGLPTHSLEKYIEFIGNGARRLVQLALPLDLQFKDETIDEYLALYKASYKESIVNKSRLFDGIPDLLSYLNQQGIPICINTNKPHDQTMLIAEKLMGTYHFEIIKGQDEDFSRKPDPACALWMAEQLGLKPEQVLFVGDSGVDAQTANNANMPLVCVEWGYSPKQEMIEAGCVNFVKTAEELKQYIEERLK